MVVISSYNKDRLVLQSDLKKLETNEYLVDETNENFDYINKKFFMWEPLSKAKLLNSWSNLFSTVSDIYASYVWAPVWSLDNSISKYVKDFVSLWFSTIWLERVEWNLVLSYIPAKWYYRQDWLDKVARFYKNDDSDVSTDYVLIQTFLVWAIESKLYQTSSIDLLDFSNSVDLNTIPETANLEEVQITWLDVPSIFIVKEDKREQNPASIYQSIQNIVYSVDRNITMFQTQFLQNVESYVIFKNINFPTSLLEDYNNGKMINMARIGKYIMWNDDSGVEFVNNQNDMIDKAISYEQTQIRRLSGATAIPQEFLWLEQKNSAIGAWSRVLSHWSFIKRIEWIRSIFDDTFREIEAIVSEENNEDISYVWGDVLAKTDFELLEEMKIKKEIWLLDRKSSLMLLEWVDEDWADNIIENIRLDTELRTPDVGSVEEEEMEE
jgi:hypothetical protein